MSCADAPSGNGRRRAGQQQGGRGEQTHISHAWFRDAPPQSRFVAVALIWQRCKAIATDTDNADIC